MKIFSTQLLDGGDMSADVTSSEAGLDHMEMAAIHAKWSGSSPTGSLIVQATVNGTDWVAVSTDTTLAVTATGEKIFHLSNIGYRKCRVFWDKTSGTGSLDVWISAKGA